MYFVRGLKTAALLRPDSIAFPQFVNWWEPSFKNFGETDIAVISLCLYFAETHNVSKLNLQHFQNKTNRMSLCCRMDFKNFQREVL